MYAYLIVMLVIAAGVTAMAMLPLVLTAWFMAAVLLTGFKFLGTTVMSWFLVAFCSGGIALALARDLFLEWKERNPPE